MGQVLSHTYGGTFCQWWYSSSYHRIPSRTSLGDRKNIYFIVVINYEGNSSQILSRHIIFLLSMQNGIFHGSLTAGAIGGEPYCEFSNPVAGALKPFSNPHSSCVLSGPIHWVKEPAPLENQNISFFAGHLRYSGTTTPSTIFWTFMPIHNSSLSLLYYLAGHEPTFCSLLKSFDSIVKTNFSYFNESSHRCAVVLMVPDHCKQKQTYFKLKHNT